MSNRSITGYHLNTFTIRISQRFSSAWEFQMGNFQKYWSQNVGQDFIILDFLVGGISCRRKRCVRENNVSRAWDPVHVGDKALTQKTPAKRGRVNRYDIMAVISVISWRLSQLYHGSYLSYIMVVISVISWWLSQLYHGGYLSYIMAVISGGNISSSMKNVQTFTNCFHTW
jgi:hypothetical protein